MFVDPEIETIDTLLSFAPQITLCLKLLNKLSLTKFLPQTAFLIPASTPESSSRHLILFPINLDLVSGFQLHLKLEESESNFYLLIAASLRFAEQSFIKLRSITTTMSKLLKLINERMYKVNNRPPSS